MCYLRPKVNSGLKHGTGRFVSAGSRVDGRVVSPSTVHTISWVSIVRPRSFFLVSFSSSKLTAVSSDRLQIQSVHAKWLQLGIRWWEASRTSDSQENVTDSPEWLGGQSRAVCLSLFSGIFDLSEPIAVNSDHFVDSIGLWSVAWTRQLLVRGVGAAINRVTGVVGSVKSSHTPSFSVQFFLQANFWW